MAIGTPTTAGDKYLEGAQSEFNATVIQRLLDEGAILIGKTNMDSWGFGSTTENSAYGVTKNPFDKTKVAGGSSGGSAAAVALEMCTFAIGEDTGGSVRGPASYCGVYGYKPTYGLISRFGCIAYASSLDSVGIFTNSAEDIGIVCDVIAGPDGSDMTVENVKELRVASYGLGKDNSQPVTRNQKTEKLNPKKTFAYSIDFIPEEINEDTKRIYLETIEKFKAAGYEAVEVNFSTFTSVIPTYYITAMSEASTNLSRYQGTRYGKFNDELQITNYKLDTDKPVTRNSQTEKLNSWEDLFTTARSDGFGPEAKRRTLMGAYVLSEGYFDAYYKKAQKIRNKIYQEIEKALENTDFILSPVTPSSAVKIGEKSTNPVEMYLEDIYTVTANLAGIPAISFPAGKDKNNMPIGMQIMGNKFDDQKLIEVLKGLYN
jgi:aspartyl-tRNA(Asn)/glutamyl-tRNA(Gln) amidotransferase subunit A